MDLTVERERYAESLAQNLERVVKQLSQMPAVQRVVLFGSYAAGRRDLLTDLDLLVVMDSELGFLERQVEVGRLLHASVALDVLVYTPQELDRMRERPFIRHALKTGKVLYERQAIG